MSNKNGIKRIDYRRDLINFNKDINFENTGMVLYPATDTSSGTKIWYVGFDGTKKYKFSMYNNRRNRTLEFRCCSINDTVTSVNSKRIAVVNSEEFTSDEDVGYKVLSDLYEELA